MNKREGIVIIGADHAGYKYKEKLKKFFSDKKIKYEDYGAFNKDNKDDYPVYAFKVAEKVSKNKKARGILICGTGEGMIIAANKVKSIRAVQAHDIYSAKMSRIHNDANILGLGARDLSFYKIRKIVQVWLNTKFSGEKRHKRRIKEIEDYKKKR